MQIAFNFCALWQNQTRRQTRKLQRPSLQSLPHPRQRQHLYQRPYVLSLLIVSFDPHSPQKKKLKSNGKTPVKPIDSDSSDDSSEDEQPKKTAVSSSDSDSDSDSDESPEEKKPVKAPTAKKGKGKAESSDSSDSSSSDESSSDEDVKMQDVQPTKGESFMILFIPIHLNIAVYRQEGCRFNQGSKTRCITTKSQVACIIQGDLGQCRMYSHIHFCSLRNTHSIPQKAPKANGKAPESSDESSESSSEDEQPKKAASSSDSDESSEEETPASAPAGKVAKGKVESSSSSESSSDGSSSDEDEDDAKVEDAQPAKGKLSITLSRPPI